MNSTISNSNATIGQGAADVSRWSRWLVIFLTVTLLGAATLWCTVTVLDPFSTGRLTPLRRIDIASKNTLLGHAARVRDPRFNAAIIGNSHAIPLDPKRIGDATGLRFAQLGVAGIQPGEEFIIGRAFERHHADRAVVVVILDDSSCAWEDRTLRAPASFPAFLFEGSDWDYIRHIMFSDTINAGARRLGILLGLAGEAERPDGFDPFGYQALTRGLRIARIAGFRRPSHAPDPNRPPPALALLEAFVAELSPQTGLLLYFTPMPANTLPVPGSAAARWLEACKVRYRALTDARQNSAFLDRMIDDAFARDIDNFEDVEHIRNGSAPVLENDIIEALRTMRSRRAKQ
jgi:hypothetical protein